MTDDETRDIVSRMGKRIADQQHLMIASLFRAPMQDGPLLFHDEPYEPRNHFREMFAYRIRDDYLPIVREPYGLIRISNIGRGEVKVVLPRRPRSKKKRILKKWAKRCYRLMRSIDASR